LGRTGAFENGLPIFCGTITGRTEHNRIGFREGNQYDSTDQLFQTNECLPDWVALQAPCCWQQLASAAKAAVLPGWGASWGKVRSVLSFVVTSSWFPSGTPLLPMANSGVALAGWPATHQQARGAGRNQEVAGAARSVPAGGKSRPSIT